MVTLYQGAVVTATIARVLHDDVIGRIADALVAYQDKESTLLPSLKQQLRKCEKSIQNMLNAIEAGIITPSTKQRLQDLETRREELNVSILQEQLQKPRFTKEQIVAWISRFKYGDPDDPEYQKQIIDTFVNSVYVYDDRLVMTYNYKDGIRTIVPMPSVKPLIRICQVMLHGTEFIRTRFFLVSFGPRML